MRAFVDGRDSLVVLPTGGGKSLCYQAPAVLRGDTTVVISPLISLMKDQVDSLRANGVPAAQLDSSQSAEERSAYEMDLRQRAIRLLFVSPERMVLTGFYQLLQEVDVRTFAIDEAHCISHWGHDFRPEYRQLNRLKEHFPRAAVHAYTATATERVRKDIIAQLGLRDPEVLVGNFDRPNLTYRILSRRDLYVQTMDVIHRHRGEAGIIYCIRRRDVDDLATALQAAGINALPYHAGMQSELRRATQDAFAAEKCDVVVATIAFGMGIDRSNVRYVLHTAMPKSVEHYQQETGRAGRDGLEAECVLLHAGSDFTTWKWILEKSQGDSGVDESFLPNALKHLEDLDRYCRSAVCRHRALVQYFGQTYAPDNCGACDLCLGDAEPVADAVTVAKKILSCVARVQERFGIRHVASVLRGENTEGIRKWGHDKLSTYGLLRDCDKAEIVDWLHQLVGQKLLDQEEITLASAVKASILRLNDASWEVMRGQRSVRLMRPARREKDEQPVRSSADTASWEGVDRDLFEELRKLRRLLAEERQWQPYMVFSDASLRELARCRPSTAEKMRLIYGVGDSKLRDFGPPFLARIVEFCTSRQLAMDVAPDFKPVAKPRTTSSRPNPERAHAFCLFQQRQGIEQVAELTQRSPKTVVGYLEEWIQEQKPASISTWVSDEIYSRVASVVTKVGADRLKPIYLELGEQVPYDLIRLVVSHLAAGRV